MTKDLMCSDCATIRPMNLVHSAETVTIHGKEITFDAEFYRCPECGEEFEEGDQVDRNLAAAREVFDRLYATPSAEEIVALRERYSISQKALGSLLGFGEVTINSYESGASKPQPTNRLLLKLVENPLVFKEIYRLNKDKLSALQRKKIEASEGYADGKATYTVMVSRTSHSSSTSVTASSLDSHYTAGVVNIDLSAGVAS